METEFKYKSGQYAEMLGITKEALRSRRRRGELETEYIIQNGITLWRKPASNHGKKPGGQSCLSPLRAPTSKEEVFMFQDKRLTIQTTLCSSITN